MITFSLNIGDSSGDAVCSGVTQCLDVPRSVVLKLTPGLMWGQSVPLTVQLHFAPGDQQEMGEGMFWLYTAHM